jgi:preprotein translocase subunit YajC
MTFLTGRLSILVPLLVIMSLFYLLLFSTEFNQWKKVRKNQTSTENL